MKKITTLKVAITSALFFFLFTMISFAQKAPLFENFEASAWNGSNYNLRTITDELGTWTLSGIGKPDNNDRRHGERSIRLRGESSDKCHIRMDFDKAKGIGVASFYYASYAAHKDGVIVLYYSTDGGATWTSAGSVTAPAWDGEMKKASFTLNVPGNVRVKISREENLKNSTSVNIDDLNLTDFVCENCVEAPTFNPPGGIQTGPINVVITSATPGATIRYTLDGKDPEETSDVYSTPIPVSKTTIIRAQAWKEEMEPSPISGAQYSYPVQVSSLAELRALAPEYKEGSSSDNTVYTYTGQAVVTHIQDYNKVNVRYIQDATAAILIYDNKGDLKSKWNHRDLVSNLSGTLTNYWGLIEFIPIEGECEAIDINHKISPTVIPISDLDDDYDNPIQAKLIKVKGVMFANPPGTYEHNKYYDLKQNTLIVDSAVFTDNWNADYIVDKDPIPTTYAVDLVGICKYAYGKNRLVIIDKSNDIVSVPEINKSAIKLSPNPANSFVNIVTGSAMKLEVYNLLGILMATENLNEGKNTIPVSNFPAGIYFMKMIDTADGKTFVQKLIVK